MPKQAKTAATPFMFLNLLPELQLLLAIMMAECMDAREFLRFCITSKSMTERFAKNEELWNKLLKRNLTTTPQLESSETSLDAYKKKYGELNGILVPEDEDALHVICN